MTSFPRKLATLSFVGALCFNAIVSTACEDLEVADYNPEFRPIPTIERAPTVETAPTIAAAPTTTQFEGFKQAPTAEKFEGFEQAPTVTQADSFKQAPTPKQFAGFNEGNPCQTYLENPNPSNAQKAAQWAIAHLEAAGDQVDPNDPLQITAACQAVLNR